MPEKGFFKEMWERIPKALKLAAAAGVFLGLSSCIGSLEGTTIHDLLAAKVPGGEFVGLEHDPDAVQWIGDAITDGVSGLQGFLAEHPELITA